MHLRGVGSSLPQVSATDQLMCSVILHGAKAAVKYSFVVLFWGAFLTHVTYSGDKAAVSTSRPAAPGTMEACSQEKPHLHPPPNVAFVATAVTAMCRRRTLGR